MKSSLILSLAATVLALPQSSSPPAGCSPDAAGSFQITTVLAKRSLEERQAVPLTLTLAGGILKDSQGRIGYIASNYQFQFDNPVQNGAQASSGWSLCKNGSLALAGSTSFYQCLSGNFYNLYSAPVGAECLFINFVATTVSSGASQVPDGQPQATKPVTQLPDGQPQATTAAKPVTQIPDGQPQATKPGKPVSQIPDGQPQATVPGKPVSQIPDGQPQATVPGKPVSQIPDGQPQATAPASKPPVVTQIPDGQPQASAPASKPPAVTQIPDGQPQAPKPASTLPVVSQIPDGQPQATKPALPTFTGAAVAVAGNAGFVAAGLLGLLAFL